MIGWQEDKAWSDRFLPQIKAILGVFLLREPTREEDQLRNTDLIVLKMDSARIACRVRRNEYLARYGHQFTMRIARRGGTETELTKVLSGWGNYLFYGFADEAGERLAQWFIGDLNVFRLWYNRWLLLHGAREIPGEQRSNGDGSSDFCAFDLAAIPRFVAVSSAVQELVPA